MAKAAKMQHRTGAAPPQPSPRRTRPWALPSAPEAKPLAREEEEETRVIPALVAGIQRSTTA